MAKDRRIAPDPPVESEESGEEATSEEKDENGGSGAESDSESEQEESTQPIKKPHSTQAPAVETSKPPSSDTSDEVDSSSDSEFDSPETKLDPNIYPIASKPVEATAANKSRSRAKSSILSSPKNTSLAAGAKRQATSETCGDGEGKKTKRLKKKPEKYADESEKNGSTNDDSRKLFQRLWSEEDEIAILKGMIDFTAKRKVDPVASLDFFHEFIKKSLSIDVSRTQLKDKIRRLRCKYANNADTEKGKEKIFAKDHEKKAFELSKKVWSNEKSTFGKKLESPKMNEEVMKKSRIKNVNTKKPLNEVKEEGDKEENPLISKKTGIQEGLKPVNSINQNLVIEDWIMDNSQFIDEQKRAEMDEKWKKFKVVEAEFFTKKLELLLEESKLILDALKSSSG